VNRVNRKSALKEKDEGEMMTVHSQTPHAAAAERMEKGKAPSRTGPLLIGLLAGTLALAALAPASAQVGRMSGPSLWDYTGVLMPRASIPPRIPNTWIVPIQVFHYEVPQAIYVPVPVPVATERPAVEPVQVATLTLRSGSAPADVRVKPGTVVTWRNGDNQDYTLVVPRPSASGAGGGDASQRWRIRANDSFSLAFNRPGTYDYYRLEEPNRRARIIVTE
jgi:plastocyanin